MTILRYIIALCALLTLAGSVRLVKVTPLPLSNFRQYQFLAPYDGGAYTPTGGLFWGNSTIVRYPGLASSDVQTWPFSNAYGRGVNTPNGPLVISESANPFALILLDKGASKIVSLKEDPFGADCRPFIVAVDRFRSGTWFSCDSALYFLSDKAPTPNPVLISQNVFSEPTWRGWAFYSNSGGEPTVAVSGSTMYVVGLNQAQRLIALVALSLSSDSTGPTSLSVNNDIKPFFLDQYAYIATTRCAEKIPLDVQADGNLVAVLPFWTASPSSPYYCNGQDKPFVSALVLTSNLQPLGPVVPDMSGWLSFANFGLIPLSSPNATRPFIFFGDTKPNELNHDSQVSSFVYSNGAVSFGTTKETVSLQWQNENNPSNRAVPSQNGLGALILIGTYLNEVVYE